jgi:Mg2+/citrate symporter
MLDLIVAVSLGILASGISFGLLASTGSASVMTVFPMSLIPTFLVPLSFILHLIGLYQLRVRSQL